MKIISSELYVKDNKVYHEGNKPKPKDIGAAPETHTHNYASATTPGGSAEHAIKATEDSLGQRIDKYIKGLSVSGRTITYTRGDGTTGTITTQDNDTDTKVTNTLNTTAKAYITGTTNSATNTGTQVFDTNVYLDTTAGMLTATTFKGALQGNATTATSATSASHAAKLTTPRSINGTNFDGTGNITTANWGTARNIQIGNSSKSVNGSSNMTWTLAEIGAAPDGHTHNYAPISHEQDYAGTNSNTYIAYPKDGRYRSSSNNANVTGYLKITLPQTWTSTMMKFDVDVFNYVDNETMTYTISGYNYSNGASSAWHSVTAACKTHQSNPKRNLSVRFGHDGTKCAIYIGEASTVWSYPQVTVKNITVAYSNYALTSWNTGWVVGFTTTLGTINKTVTNPYVGNGGMASTANTLATTRTINGTSFNGSANITTANWGTARTLTIGNTGKSVNGSGNVSWSIGEIGAAPASHNHTSLSGITNLSFATEGTDSASITTTVEGASTYLDFNLSDDIGQNDMWRWRFGAWDSSTSSTKTFNAMTLTATSTTAAKLTVPGTIQASTFSGALSGNATTATTLATARTINGTSFNGSANITTANWGTARNIQIGNAVKSVNGSGNVTWNWSEMQVPRAYSSSYSFGGNQNAITTAQFITMLTDLGAFSQPHWVSRGSWSYASNQYINDTGCGNIHLAGCVVEVFGNSSAYTIKVTTPTTSASGVTNGDFIYVNNGSNYSPGWRRLYSTAYKPTASEIGAAAASHTHSYLPLSGGNVTGRLNVGGRCILPPVYNYSNGILINICAAASQTMVAIHVTGNSYGAGVPINSLFNFYDYTTDGGIINASGIHHGYNIGNMTVYRNNGRLYAWIKQPANFQTYNIEIITNGKTIDASLSDAAIHSSGNTHSITITPSQASLNGHTHSYLPLSGGTMTGAIIVSGESIFHNGTYTDPWHGTGCAIKASGHVAVGGQIKATSTVTAPTFAGALSGNATTATTLQTARTINGTSFNGSENITTANWGTARNITIGNTSKSVNGSANVSWSLSEIGAAPASHNHGLVNLNSEAFSGGNDLNTYNSTKTWVARTFDSTANRPGDWYTVANFGAGVNSNFQLAHSYGNSSTLYVRGRHDTSGNYTPWAKVYTDKNKPTASEIGAAASSSVGTLSSLKTSAKENLVAAINEVFQSGNNVKQNLVDTLIAKGAEDISTSNSWDSLIDMIEGSNINLAPISFNVEQLPNAQYGFHLLGSGYYESENFGIHNSYAMCKLNIVCNRNYNVYLDCINHAENNYDYGIISQINTPLSFSYQTDPTGVLKSFKGLSSPGVQSVQLKSESGYYYIKYVKDSTASQGNDSLRFKVRFEKKPSGNPDVPGNPGGEETILFGSTIGGNNSSLTGGYTHKNQNPSSYFTMGSSAMDLYAYSKASGGSTLETVISNNKINLTNYSTLRIRAYFTTSSNDSGGAPLVGFDAIGNRDSAFAASTAITSSAQRYYDLDISGLTGSYHLKFNVATSLDNRPGEITKHLYITELILYP